MTFWIFGNIMIVAISALHLLGSIGLFRIARYTCFGLAWLSFIPVVNLVYLCAVADKLNVESMECDWSVHAHIAISAIVVSVLGFFMQKYILTDITIIAGRIMFLTGIVTFLIDLSMAYYGIIDKALPLFWLMFIISAPIGFAPLLFVGSFTLPKRVEAELEDMHDYDVDNG